MPEFEADVDRHYLITTIRVRDGFEVQNENFVQKNDRSLTEVLTEVLSKKNYEKVLPLIEHIDKYGKITPKEAETILNKSTSTAYRYLGILVNAGVIEAEGNTNNSVYVIR